MIPDKIVDASAVVAYLFQEPAADQVADMMRDAALFAPDLLPYEVANVCATKLRRHPDHRVELMRMYDMFDHLPIDLVAIDHRSMLQLAERTGLSAYDASYLWLAQRLDAELITLDRKLADAAARAG